MKGVIIAFFVIIAGIIGLDWYLGPDDLAGCGERPSGKTGCQPADAVVAISGGDTDARTGEAIRLYTQGWAKALIFAGAAQDKTGPSNASVMRDQALAAGVPDAAIIVEDQSEDTRENAVNVARLTKKHGFHSLIVVTSAYHQRRAQLEFKRVADFGAVRSHPVASDNQWSGLWWATPAGWWLALGETAKILAFYTSGDAA